MIRRKRISIALICCLVYGEDKAQKGEAMIHPMITPIVALVAGILILIFPELLNLVVAIYLIAIGVMGILGTI